METLNTDRENFHYLSLGRLISIEVPHDENLVVASKVRIDCGLDSRVAEIVMVNRRAQTNKMLVVLKKYPPL